MEKYYCELHSFLDGGENCPDCKSGRVELPVKVNFADFKLAISLLRDLADLQNGSPLVTRRAAEMDKMNIAYVRGILKKHYEDLAKKKEKQEAAIKKAETLKASQSTELIKPGTLTGSTTNKYLQEEKKLVKTQVIDLDKNSIDYKRRLSLMNQQIDQEIKKGAYERSNSFD